MMNLDRCLKVSCGRLQGAIVVPSDKSITHRAILLAALATGSSKIVFRSIGRDNLASLRIIRQLGVSVRMRFTKDLLIIAEEEGLLAEESPSDCSEIVIEGKGTSLTEPREALFCGNSGTTARLLCGILAGQDFKAKLLGDASLSCRPFERVTLPLKEMGAEFLRDYDLAEGLPLSVQGRKLKGIHYQSPKASAQVKSAILLAGLQAQGVTSITEPTQSRNHTELMLRAMGCEVLEGQTAEGLWQVGLSPDSEEPRMLRPLDCLIPGDLSSAAFPLVAATLVPGSCVEVRGVGVNRTRSGVLDVLKRMGASIAVFPTAEEGGEAVATIKAEHRTLSAADISTEDVVKSIDEIPLLMLASAFAKGETRLTGAQELRVKECDRLSMMSEMLQEVGVEIADILEDGMTIVGNPELVYAGLPSSFASGSWINSEDHRILMCGAVLAYILSGKMKIYGPREVVETSFPGFVDLFTDLMGN